VIPITLELNTRTRQHGGGEAAKRHSHPSQTPLRRGFFWHKLNEYIRVRVSGANEKPSLNGAEKYIQKPTGKKV
jgi:hypothetical protein